MKRLILLMLFPVLAFAQTTKPPVATGSQDNVARDSIVTHRRNIDSLFTKVGNKGVKYGGTSGNLLMISSDSVASYSSPSDVKFVAAEYVGLPAPYYATPAAAVAAASEGDVIHIAPGVYSGGFTVAVDNLTIIGQAPAEFQSSDSTFGAGVLINGSCSAAGKKNFTLQNVTIAKRDADGDVFTCGTTGSAKINHTYINCRFVGTSWGNGYHAFLSQAGSHVTIRDCKVYRSSHGFALRASYISASGLYAEDCGSESGIIIKAATGSGSAEYVNISDFTITATVAGRARGAVIVCSNNGVRASQVNLTSGVIYGTASAGVYVLQDSGAVVDVTVSSVNVRKSGTSSFWVGSGSRVAFVNCLSDSATNYGFLNTAGTYVSVIGSRVNASSTYSGAFTTEVAGSMQVYGTATLGAAAVTGDLSLSGVASFDSTLYMKKGEQFLNKAGTDWHSFTTRNTSGSQAVYDVSNVGTLSAFGLGTFGSLTATGALNVGTTSVFDGIMYLKSSAQVLNKAGDNWLTFATRDATGSDAVMHLTNLGSAVLSNGDSLASQTFAKNATNISAGTLNAARLPNSGVGAGSYTYPYSVTVDQYGRVTSATAGAKPAFGDTLMTKYADSTGIASASRATMVWNSTLNKWQVQQAVKIGTALKGIPFMYSSDSLGTIIDSAKVVSDTLRFYVGGVAYKAVP